MIIDFHSHILPKLDHGSDSVETSLAQLDFARKAGVDTVIATSHFYPHMHNAIAFFEKRADSYNELMLAAQDREIPKIVLGAEVLVCEGINKLPDLELLAIEGTKSILLELPFGLNISEAYINTLESICESGFDIILAHADRYDPKNIERILPCGAKIQLNASAFSHLTVKKHIKKWIDKGLVVALGSDIHKADQSAYKKFNRAISRLGVAAPIIMEASYNLINKK